MSPRRPNKAAFNLRRLKLARGAGDPARALKPGLSATGKRQHGFERPKRCGQYNRKRGRALDNALFGGRWAGRAARTRKQAKQLSKLLQQVRGIGGNRSFANAYFNRALRRRLVHALFRAVRRGDLADVAIYHVASDAWRCDNGALDTGLARRLQQALKTNLYRAGLAELDGWVGLFFDNNFNEALGKWEPHFHAIVVGAKQGAFEALRELPMFVGGADAPIYRPIVRQDLENFVRQLAYLMTYNWYKVTQRDGPDTHARPRRRNFRNRLDAPQEVEATLFLDAQRFSDLIWFHGIDIRGGELVAKRAAKRRDCSDV